MQEAHQPFFNPKVQALEAENQRLRAEVMHLRKLHGASEARSIFEQPDTVPVSALPTQLNLPMAGRGGYKEDMDGWHIYAQTVGFLHDYKVAYYLSKRQLLLGTETEMLQAIIEKSAFMLRDKLLQDRNRAR